MRAVRDRIPAADREAGSRAVLARIVGLPAFAGAGTVLAYAHLGSEVATDALLAAVRQAGKRLVLPRVAGNDLSLHAVADPARDLGPGTWGIPEPAPGGPTVPPAEVDLFLLPGLAFDRAGNRLGYGRGFFDRVLAGAPGTKAALAFDEQVLPAVPAGPGDVAVDLIATPTRLVRCRGGGTQPDPA